MSAIMMVPWLTGGNQGYKFWRLYITASNHASGYIGIQEIQFRIKKGENSTTVPTNAVASSDNGSQYKASRAFQDTLFEWRSDTTESPPHWIYGEYEEARDVVQVYIKRASVASIAPKDFDIQASNTGNNWRTIKSVTGETGWGSLESRVFDL